MRGCGLTCSYGTMYRGGVVSLVFRVQCIKGIWPQATMSKRRCGLTCSYGTMWMWPHVTMSKRGCGPLVLL